MRSCHSAHIIQQTWHGQRSASRHIGHRFTTTKTAHLKERQGRATCYHFEKRYHSGPGAFNGIPLSVCICVPSVSRVANVTRFWLTPDGWPALASLRECSCGSKTELCYARQKCAALFPTRVCSAHPHDHLVSNAMLSLSCSQHVHELYTTPPYCLFFEYVHTLWQRPRRAYWKPSLTASTHCCTDVGSFPVTVLKSSSA